jgi:hypothetical protein
MLKPLLVGALAALAPVAALACSIPQPPENTAALTALFARKSVDAAATVEVAVAERATPILGAEALRPWLDSRPATERPDALRLYRSAMKRPMGQRISFRVVERLKGRGPATFSLNGGAFESAMRPDGESVGGAPVHQLDPAGRPVPFTVYSPTEIAADNVVPLTSCFTGPVSAEKGAAYLVFRDARGRLLGPVRFYADAPAARTYAYTRVNRTAPDPWLAAVREAARVKPTRR